MTFLLLLLAFSALLFLLTWLNHRIFIATNLLAFYLTHSPPRAYILYFLLMLPGIFVHEGAHWIVARILELRPSKFRVWPKLMRKHIRLGSVTAKSGGVFYDSMVGVAPLLVGSLLVAWIGQQVFAAEQIATAFVNGDLPALLTGLSATFAQTDGPLWAYLLFTIANGMMPSTADREPFKPVMIYSLFALSLYLLLGLPLEPFTNLLTTLTIPLQAINSALLLTILLDCVVLFIVSIINALIQRNRRTE